MARYYRINGKLYTSVTTALSVVRKEGLERWRGEVGNEEADRIRDEAAEAGSTIHDRCALIAQGNAEPDSPATECFASWLREAVAQVIHVEKVVWSEAHRYAGRSDLVAWLKGDRLPSVIDIKTGRVWPEHGLQLAAYQRAYAEHGIKVERRLVIQLDRDGSGYTVREFRDPRDFHMFLYALALYNYFHEGEEGGEIVEVRA